MKIFQDKEILVNYDLVKKLVHSQFPQWSNLNIRKVNSIGTDNIIYRLGDQLAIRLPKVASSVENITKEYLWLPKLAGNISTSISQPVALGSPVEDYPYPWLIFKWISGNDGIDTQLNLDQTALFLANFINELHGVDIKDAPLAKRGLPLSTSDVAVKEVLPKLARVINVEHAKLVWDKLISTPVYEGKPVWVHSDLHAGNILVADNKVVSVIDFGIAGIGDPACDMLPAWTLLDELSRIKFKANLNINDDATWQRGKGWALSFGLIAWPYCEHKNPVLADIALQTIKQVLQSFELDCN